MSTNQPLIIYLLLVIALGGCASPSSRAQPALGTNGVNTASIIDTEANSQAAQITGVAFYRERIALPRGAVLVVTLEDVSQVGGPAITVGQTVIAEPKTPIRFSLEYKPNRLTVHGRYAVRAMINVDDKPRFSSSILYPILTFDGDSRVDILMESVGDSEAANDLDEQAWPSYGLQLPATLRGELPCADCQAIRYQIDLWPDQIFHLRRDWLGQNQTLVSGDMGRWRVDPERRVLILSGGLEPPLQFSILGANQLRLLDLSGQPIESNLPYVLNSLGRVEMADIPAEFVGYMTYMADAVRFTECRTGRSYPIVPSEQTLQMERQYLANVEQPGGLLAMRFRGKLTQGLSMEADRFEPTWEVEQFIGMGGNVDCIAE